MKYNNRGQLSLINIIFFMILALVMAVCSSVINSFLSEMVAANNYSATATLLINLIVPMMWIGLVITFFLYVVPMRPQQY